MQSHRCTVTVGNDNIMYKILFFCYMLTLFHLAPVRGFPQSVTHPVPPVLAPNLRWCVPRDDTPQTNSRPPVPLSPVDPLGRCRISPCWNRTPPSHYHCMLCTHIWQCLLDQCCIEEKQTIVWWFTCSWLIRGEPERAPNTRVTYGEFAVPMYVCIYVCMYVCM